MNAIARFSAVMLMFLFNFNLFGLRIFLSSILERVVFPGERLIFEAVPDAQLEIYSREIRSRLVSCYHLRVTLMSEK